MAEFTTPSTYSDSTAAPASDPTSPKASSEPAAPGALSTLAAAVPSLDAVKARFAAVFDKSRPWAEFANTGQFARPGGVTELRERMTENGSYYLFNYLAVLAVLTVFTVLTSPLAIIGIVMIAAAYVQLFVVHPEAYEVFGMELDNQKKSGAVVVGSLVVLWLTGAGAAFTSLLVSLGVVSAVHAALRRAPSEADFDTAFAVDGP